ncbi:hypothetical protein LOK49_LG12G02173 [Camellia lanceoleosa]|uniref:Uncharacterized protein n=1 Tax=Camellia lanceoleosa TaxID=1840588 RepID=A0ACC0FS16_9ERIC|nr:hypothetical protein LOK49_LG12G02173 [Camellia lanceoleosa]
MSSPVAPPLLVFSLRVLLSILLCSSDDTTFKGIDLENPVIDVTPSPSSVIIHHLFMVPKMFYCVNARVLWSPRLELGSYASAYQVSIFLLLGIVVAGAALGCWLVWKFVISDDGSGDVAVAQFVKWATRVIAATFIFQRTLDTPLVMGALASCLSICFLITSFKWNGPDSTITFGNSIYSANGNPWRSIGRANVGQNRAEFLSRSGMVASRGTLWNNPRRSSGWSDSPVKGMHIC